MSEARAIILAAPPGEHRSRWASLLRDYGRRVAEVDNGAVLQRLLAQAQQRPQPLPTVVLAARLPDYSCFEIIQECNRRGLVLPFLLLACPGQLSAGDQMVLADTSKVATIDELELVGIVVNVMRIEQQFEQLHAQKQQWSARAAATSVETMREQYHSRLMQQLQEFDFDPGAAPGAFALEAPPPYLQYRRHSPGQAEDLLLVHARAGKLTLLVADIGSATIEGVYRALLTRTFFEENMRLGRDSGQFMAALHAQFRLEPQLDPPLVCAVLELDLEHGVLEIMAAGYPGITLVRQDSPVPLPMIAPGFPLGWSAQPMFGHRCELIQEGDRILLFTDGITNRQRFDPQHLTIQRLSECRLDEMVQYLRPLMLDEMISGLWRQILQFGTAPLVENMLLVGLEVPRLGDTPSL